MTVAIVIITSALALGVDKSETDSTNRLFVLRDVPKGRQGNCFMFFEKGFGNHKKKNGRVDEFCEGDIYYEWREYAVMRKKEHFPTSIRVHAIGKVRSKVFPRPDSTENIDDSAHTVQRVEYTIELPETIQVKDAIILVARSLGVESYRSRHEENGDENLVDFLKTKRHTLFQAKEGIVTLSSPRRPRRETSDPKPGHVVTLVQANVPRQ